ncbi:hypothetical protein [Bacillus andreraoultii]|uniref:hypothetical protein n=1 Tax=Bacillus andreraoultii TaxID=1499685 RepID=UPI00053AF430|nr:hypothetical protein [Bacillus andreraoultii]
MNDFKQFIGKNMYFKLNGENSFTGRLVDAGNDIVVIYDGEDFVYISVYHVNHYRVVKNIETEIAEPNYMPPIQDDLSSISLRKIVTAAKGIFCEIYVVGKYPIQGYITSIMNDYFVFYSPVYKTIYISLRHLKWLVPYNISETPYGLNKEEFPVTQLNQPLSRTFEEQLKKFIGKLVVINFGDHENKIGKLSSIENGQIEIIKARMNKAYLNMNHVQTIYFP